MGAVRQLVDELRRRGVVVHEWSGWDGRGNEGVTQITPHGAVLHHTATGYGSAFAGLVASTRSDLYGGCLCNFAGNSDGSLTVVASGLAWHAGSGAGPSLGPLAPYRSAMNRSTIGLEIVYPGDKPMTDQQYAAALVFARAVADLFGGGDIECVRAHAETNGRGGDGKWDPGWAPGQTIDMAAFRREAAATTSKEDDVTPEDIKAIAAEVGKILVPVGYGTGKDAKPPLPLTEHMRGSNHGIWTEPERVGKEVKALVQECHDDLARRIGEGGGGQVTLTDEQAQAGFDSLKVQLGAQTEEALEDLYQRLVETNSVDAVRQVLASYVGKATVDLSFKSTAPSPSGGA